MVGGLQRLYFRGFRGLGVRGLGFSGAFRSLGLIRLGFRHGEVKDLEVTCLGTGSFVRNVAPAIF